MYDLPRLRQGLRPFRLHYYPRLRSTSDHAAVLRRRGTLFAPAVVLTASQLAGRGRGGNAWYSDTGSITVTFALPIEPSLAPYQLPLIAGLAVRDAVDEILRRMVPVARPDVQLKWPNDVLVDQRKIAGLLCERIDRCDLIGVGLNVSTRLSRAPRALRDRMTTLSRWTSTRPDLTDVLLTLAAHLRRRLERRDETSFAALLPEYDRHHVLWGRTITVATEPGSPALTGRCEGLDHLGRLLLRDRQALHRIIAGHVTAL
jgi:BirA family biotin operon repressor/biotin-[acetyl-CoA-carboxylase] ligase